MKTARPVARAAVAATLLVSAPGSCSYIQAPDASSLYRLEIGAPNRAIALKEQYTLQVAAYNYSGLPLEVPPLTWTSLNESVASVDGNGIVSGRALGYAIIKAAGGGLFAYITIQIRPARLLLTMRPEVLAVGDSGVISTAQLDYNGDVIPGAFSVPWWDYAESDVAEFV